MPKTNAELWDQIEADMERQILLEAAADSQQELFDDALDRDPDDNDGDMSLEEMESLDGEPMTLDDMIEGPNENGYDRPASLRRDLTLMEENDQLRRQLGDARTQYDREFNAPERVAANQASMRDQLFNQYGMLATDEAGANRLLNEMGAQQGRIEALNNDRINTSMGRAHERYGDEFGAAFESLTRADKHNPAVQGIVRDIMGHADPGSRLMEYAQNGWGGNGSRGGGGQHWMSSYSRADSGGGGRRGGGGRDLADQAGDFDNGDVEREIFDSVFPSRY